MIYLSSDFHFGHRKSFIYEPRGFTSIEEHDKKIIENWNSIVNPEDEVYCLGDEIMNDLEHGVECFKQLNGKFHLIRGNHTTDNKLNALVNNCSNIVSFGQYATVIKFGKWSFYLSHFSTRVGNYDDEEKHTKFYCLCAHTHTKDKWLDWHDKCYHVELDAHNNMPVSIEQIIKDIKERNNQ